MELENLTIAQARELVAMFGGGPKRKRKEHHLVGQFVLIRSRDSGVHSGTLVAVSGTSVRLKDARRLWRWRGANTLNEVAQNGVSADFTRLSEPTPDITILGACEIQLVSAKGRPSLERSQWPN